jgi:TPR repeat protein
MTTNVNGLQLDPSTASADELFDLGLKFCLGQSVAADLVEAHKWFNISALKGSQVAKVYRRELSQEMTAAQVAEAQRLARALITLH